MKPLDKCCNGCDAPPQLPSFVLCSVCLAALDAKMRQLCKPPSARAEPRKPKVSLASIAAAFERNKEGL